jgi:putative sulfotransferase
MPVVVTVTGFPYAVSGMSAQKINNSFMTDKTSTGWNGAFVVGTGRCGSTLVSRAFAIHPDVLSLSEFLAGLDLDAFPAGAITGKEFWSLLSSTEGAANLLLRVGAEPDEVLYPVDSGRRFNRVSGVPRIAVFTLPALSEDPDALYERLADTVPTFAEQPISQHYRELFAVLGNLLNRPQWIERSGASGFLAAQLVAAFPAARYIYLTRELDSTARSMSRHSMFRFMALWREFVDRCGCDVLRGELPADPIPPDLADLTPERFSKESFERWMPSLDQFRQLVSMQMDGINAALASLPAQQVLVLAYEDLLDQPAEVFGRMAEFFEVAEPAGWAQRAATLVRR